MSRITLIIAPFHYGVRHVRVGAGPNRILANDLVPRLEALGFFIDIHEISPVDAYYDGDLGKSLEVIRRVAKVVRRAVEESAFPIVLAGNCNTSIGLAAGLDKKDLEIAWFDAHSDLDNPEETTEGYVDHMTVSMLTGDCWKAAMGSVPGFAPIALDRFVFCGTRDLSDPQYHKLVHSPARTVFGRSEAYDELAELRVAFEVRLQQVLGKVTQAPCLVHVDVDCLDRSVGMANEYAVPGGPTGRELLSCLDVIGLMRRPVGLALASFNPDLEGADTVARVATDAIVHLVGLDKSREGQSYLV